MFLYASCDISNKSVGLSNWSDDGKVYKWHLGTENAVDVAINVDKAMQSRDYALLRNFLSDTVRITASNGVSYDLESFITRRNEIDSIVDSRNATLEWTFSNIYSVDLDPTRGGEHVSVTYSGKYEDENGKDTWNSINRYYVIDGKVVFKPQKSEEATYAKKILKSEGKINWNETGEEIIGKINGLFPSPGAFFSFNGERYKILKAEIGNGIGQVGEIISNQLEVACNNNQSIKILEIQRQGKRPQKISEFMLGSQIKKGSKLSNV